MQALCGAGCNTCRCQPFFTQRKTSIAFLRITARFAERHLAVRAGPVAAAAADTGIVIVQNESVLGDVHRTGRTGCNTCWVFAVIAADGKRNKARLLADAYAVHPRPPEILVRQQIVAVLAGHLT